jgi:hypothetical protein
MLVVAAAAAAEQLPLSVPMAMPLLMTANQRSQRWCFLDWQLLTVVAATTVTVNRVTRWRHPLPRAVSVYRHSDDCAPQKVDDVLEGRERVMAAAAVAAVVAVVVVSAWRRLCLAGPLTTRRSS